jgi:hypothetical protein
MLSFFNSRLLLMMSNMDFVPMSAVNITEHGAQRAANPRWTVPN